MEVTFCGTCTNIKSPADSWSGRYYHFFPCNIPIILFTSSHLDSIQYYFSHVSSNSIPWPQRPSSPRNWSRTHEPRQCLFDSEDAVGEWVKRSGNRDDIFLATKFAIQYDAATGGQTVRSDPEYVKAACENSLKKLGVETIDLYYCHRVDGVTPIEKTIEAMVELKK